MGYDESMAETQMKSLAQASGAISGTDTTQAPELVIVLGELRDARDRITRAMDILADRLAPVLREPYASPNAPGSDPRQGRTTPFGSSLQEEVDSLYSLGATLADLVNRLEV